jgi:dihydrofolate reductase
MKISLIVAVAKNGAIGKNNQLLWHLPLDMQYFKNVTKGHTVIMGRKNFESIPEKYRPLPNRTNIILTRKANFFATNCLIANSLEYAIALAEKNNETECFIIGGGEVYKEALQKKLCTKLYITYVNTEVPDADTFFYFEPDASWKKSKDEQIKADKNNRFDMQFCVFEKMG